MVARLMASLTQKTNQELEGQIDLIVDKVTALMEDKLKSHSVNAQHGNYIGDNVDAFAETAEAKAQYNTFNRSRLKPRDVRLEDAREKDTATEIDNDASEPFETNEKQQDRPKVRMRDDVMSTRPAPHNFVSDFRPPHDRKQHHHGYDAPPRTSYSGGLRPDRNLRYSEHFAHGHHHEHSKREYHEIKEQWFNPAFGRNDEQRRAYEDPEYVTSRSGDAEAEAFVHDHDAPSFKNGSQSELKSK